MSKKAILPITLVVVFAVVVIVGVIFFATGNKKYEGVITDSETSEPIEGVAVTNGRTVVKTDENGAFTLKGYRKTRFITMTVPSGYNATGNGDDYYIRVDKSVKSYDFKLTKEATSTTDHTFLQLSDTEIGKDGVGEWINETKRLVDELNPKFLIHTGDICYEDGLNQHIKGMNTENMGVPVKYIIGNHDYVKGKYGEELFETNYGPIWYSFEIGNVHYVVTPFQFGDFKSGYNKNDRWRWLENDLANTDPNKKVVIFNHDSFKGEEGFTIKFDRKELDLKKHNLEAWIFGHYHNNFANNIDDVLHISTARPDCGGIDSSPSGTRQFSMNKDGKIDSTKLFYYDMNGKTQNTVDGQEWSVQLDGNILFCDTLNVGDKIFVGTIDDDYPRNCGVYGIDATNGSVLWNYKTKNSVKNNLGYAQGKIIAQDSQGNVYCLDETTGVLLWEKKVNLIAPTYTNIGICVTDDVAYVGGGDTVTALNATTGETIWENSHGSSEGSPTRMIITGNKLIVGANWNSLYALETSTGKKLWDMKNDGLRYRTSTPYALDDNTLIATAGKTIFLINSQKGEIIKKADFENYNFDVSSQPLVDGEIAYIATATTGVAAFNVKTLEKLWDFDTKRSIIYTSPYTSGDKHTVESTIKLSGNNLIFGASDGYLYTLNKADGTIVSEKNVGIPMLSSPALYNDSVVFSAFNGTVTKVK